MSPDSLFLDRSARREQSASRASNRRAVHELLAENEYSPTGVRGSCIPLPCLALPCLAPPWPRLIFLTAPPAPAPTSVDFLQMMTAADVVVSFASSLLLHNEDRRHLGWRVGCDRRLRIRRWRCPRQLDLPDWDQWFCFGLLQISGRRLLRTRFDDGGLRHFDAFIAGHALDRKHHQQRGHRGESGHNPDRSDPDRHPEVSLRQPLTADRPMLRV